MALQTSSATITGHFQALAAKLVDTVLPAQCISCYQLAGLPGRLCAGCWGELSFIEQPLCDRLGLPFAFHPGEGIVSAKALARPPVWHRARAAVEFNDMSRKLVHALKYYDRHEVADMMGQAMSRAGRDLLAGADLVVPVPLYRFRLWQRRFNQAGLLASLVAQNAGVACQSDVLQRSRPTRQQVGLSSSQRRDNVKNAFTINADNADNLYGARVVLVDDVVTTGATISACSQILLDAGCVQVDVLSFALVNNPLQLHV